MQYDKMEITELRRDALQSAEANSHELCFLLRRAEGSDSFKTNVSGGDKVTLLV